MRITTRGPTKLRTMETPSSQFMNRTRSKYENILLIRSRKINISNYITIVFHLPLVILSTFGRVGDDDCILTSVTALLIILFSTPG